MDFPPSQIMNNLSDGEYQLMLEELGRDCIEMTFGFGKSLDLSKDFPTLILTDQNIDLSKYVEVNTESMWGLMQRYGCIDAIYLNVEFIGINAIRVCFDKEFFCPELMEWFQKLINSGGEIMLNDSTQLGIIHGLVLTGIPLDIPMLIVKHVKCEGVATP